jgi:heptosyltransferase-2
MKNILIIQTASIGDVILGTSLPETLHRDFPSANIDILVKKGNEGLFIGHPFFREVLIWDKKVSKYSNLLALIHRIRKKRYDLVVNIQRFFSSGLITVLSGAAETRGFSKNPLSFLFSRRFQHTTDQGVHEVQRNFRLINDLAPSGPLLPRLYPSEEDHEKISYLTTSLFYTISPASLWFTKQYPVKKWLELIENTDRRSKIYLLGAPADRELCDEIAAGSDHPGVVNLAGRLTLLQSAVLMSGSRMNFTNDSAPMHLASAVNAPVTAIFCSTIPGFGFGPLSGNSTIAEVSFDLLCRPCGLHGKSACPEGHFKCAAAIETKSLIERL